MEPLDYSRREITDKKEIYAVLLAAQQHRWTFSYSMIVNHHVSLISTELVAIDADAGTISMTSDSANQSLRPNCPIFFRAQNGGLSLLFISKIVDTENSVPDVELQRVHKFIFPDSLRLTQKRNAIRINFSNLQDIPVTLFSNAEAPLQGKVVDISTTGAKIRFEGSIASRLTSLKVKLDCQLRLPDESLIEAKTQIMGLIYDEELNISYVRCQFLEMKNYNSLQLQKLINDASTMLNRLDPTSISQTLHAAG